MLWLSQMDRDDYEGYDKPSTGTGFRLHFFSQSHQPYCNSFVWILIKHSTRKPHILMVEISLTVFYMWAFYLRLIRCFLVNIIPTSQWQLRFDPLMSLFVLRSYRFSFTYLFIISQKSRIWATFTSLYFIIICILYFKIT